MRRTVTNSRNTASVFIESMVCFGVLLIISEILITLSPQAQSSNVSSSGDGNSSSNNILVHHNMVRLLADMVRDRLYDAVNLLEITSKEPAVQNVSFANFITKQYMGIPDNMDLPKRKVAQDILARDKDFGSIYFVTPRADTYIGEPFPNQKQLPRLNYADRDWYKGVTATKNTYISAVFMSASIHRPATAIAIPVYNLQDDTTTSKTNKHISGYWVGIVDLRSIYQSIRNLNFTNGERVLVIDHNGTALVDSLPSSAVNNNYNNKDLSSPELKDFNYLSSVKAVTKGNAGSIFETVNGTKVLAIYQPIKMGNRSWGVILTEPEQRSSLMDIR